MDSRNLVGYLHNFKFDSRKLGSARHSVRQGFRDSRERIVIIVARKGSGR